MAKDLQYQPSAGIATSKLNRALKPDEIDHYIELGLGRGVNVTDPDMWRSKTPHVVRKACKKNIIGTQECGILESYKKEVSTFEMQQQKLSLSLGKLGASHVKIGMDELYSRSSSSTKVIEGQKIETRTISFQFHFDDVPLYDNIDQAVIDAPECFLHEDDSNEFEENLANWFLRRIKDREIKSEGSEEDRVPDVDKQSALLNLVYKLNDPGCISSIYNDCKSFISHIGITHYVSAIKLGALEYHYVTSRTEQKRLAVSTSKEAGSLARAGLSRLSEKHSSFKGEERQKIGRIDSEKEEVTKEAVIGFEIQPIYKLVRIQFIQMCLKKAIKEYIQHKENSKLYKNCNKYCYVQVDSTIVVSSHCCTVQASNKACLYM